MARRGRAVTFHGAFGSKEKAERKERTRPGAFINPVTFRKWKNRGKKRWLVLTED